MEAISLLIASFEIKINFICSAGKDYSAEIEAGEFSEQPDDGDKRIVRVDIIGDEMVLAESGMYHYDWPIYCEFTYPEDKIVIMDLNSLAYFSGPGSVKPIKKAFEDGPLGGAVTHIRPIGKSGIILVSTNRDVLLHKGNQKWERIGENLGGDFPAYEGFKYFDGFSLDEIYAVGGSDVVFKFDGKCWKQMEFPTNIGLSAVCCGGDSQVYVGAGGGKIYRGKDHQWELIHDDNLALPYRDMVWHNGELWCCNDSGIWRFKNGNPVLETFPPGVRACCGHLSSRDGVLLTTGHGGAAFLDKDGEWNVLFLSTELQD